MLYPNQRSDSSVWSRVYSYPQHDSTHPSFRLFINTGSSVQIRANFDSAEARHKIPYLTVGPWAALRYLQQQFPASDLNGSGYNTIPVYRVRLEQTAIVWSTSLTDIGQVRPTLIHATGMACTAHIVCLTWPQLMRVYREEGLGRTTRFAMSAILRRRMISDVASMPDSYSALTHLYRPILLRHGDSPSPVLVSTSANIGISEPTMPRLSHYSMLQTIHGCKEGDGTRLQKFTLLAANNLAYRMALMSQLTAGPMRFVGGELVALEDMEAVRAACANISDSIPATLDEDDDSNGIDPAV